MHSYNPDVILLQETLGKSDDVICTLQKFLPGWAFSALDAEGRSRGVVTGYNMRKLKEVSSWGSENCLAMELYSGELCISFLILNIYGPCLERERF